MKKTLQTLTKNNLAMLISNEKDFNAKRLWYHLYEILENEIKIF